MTSSKTRFLVLVVAMCLSAQAVNLNRSMLGIAGCTNSLARNNYNWKLDEVNECGHNIYATLQSIADRPLVAQNKLFNFLNHSCLYDDGYPHIEGILNQWRQLGMECLPIDPNFPLSSAEIEAWRPWFFIGSSRLCVGDLRSFHSLLRVVAELTSAPSASGTPRLEVRTLVAG